MRKRPWVIQINHGYGWEPFSLMPDRSGGYRWRWLARVDENFLRERGYKVRIVNLDEEERLRNKPCHEKASIDSTRTCTRKGPHDLHSDGTYVWSIA